MEVQAIAGRATKWFERGFDQIIPVAPPGADIHPNSTIAPDNVGKVPAFPNESGFWSGRTPQYRENNKIGWTNHKTSAGDCEYWDSHGCSVGLRADYYPAIDIDIEDSEISNVVLNQAMKYFECNPPCRTGKAPKRLLMFKTQKPFRKKRLDFMDPQGFHWAVEILGMGNQYVIDGIHPKTMTPYHFNREPKSPAELVEVTEDQIIQFLKHLKIILEDLLECEVFTKDVSKDCKIPVERLVANDLDKLEEAIYALPNNDKVASTRDEYFLVCAALYNATPHDREVGKRLWLSWSEKYEDGHNDPGMAEAMFDSLETSTESQYRVGAEFLYRLSSQHGDFNYGAVVFDDASHLVVEPPVPFEAFSHQLLSAQAACGLEHKSVFIPEEGVWAFRKGMVWQPDPSGPKYNAQMHHHLNVFLQHKVREANELGNREDAEAIISKLSGQTCITAVYKLLTVQNPHLYRPLHLFDANPDILNTPDGVYCLKTGQKLEVNFEEEDHLCLKETKCSPDFEMPTPHWDQFLKMITRLVVPLDEGIEACPHGDQEIIEFLHRFLGYGLTGHTKEHQFAFFYGTGGNGKTTLLEVIRTLYGTYVTKVNSEVFTRAPKDNHPTAMTSFHGARFVYCSEFDEDDAFDSARIKELTGGDSITTRKMHQNYYTFLPTHTLAIASNWRPRLDTIDDAIKRRILLVPFDLKLEDHEKDSNLKDKLLMELPGILAWLIKGAMKWYQSGLTTSKRIESGTAKYFEESDVIQQFIDERCEVDTQTFSEELKVTKKALADAWRNYATSTGEYKGSKKPMPGRNTFNSKIESRGFPSRRCASNGAQMFIGIQLKNEEEL